MAAKRKAKARETQLAFEALSIEGGLLSPEWLSKVAQLQAGTQGEADYCIHKGLNLRDEIGRYWRIAQAHWADFKSGRAAKADARATAERFVIALLRDAFGFTKLVPVEPTVLQERTYPIGHATLGGRVPVVVAPAGNGLDTLSPAFGDGARRRSAFGLAQEYLNAQEGALWGIASDGVALRIVRDNASLTRPAWIETDLQRIFTEDRYADFAALWLLCHETRFGREGQPVSECALEAWRSAGREEGTRAREHLRRGVEDALVALGQGFLSHAENAALRVELQNGSLPVRDYFSQLLRVVYRFIFLLTVEERGLLHPEGTSDSTKALYANGYGIRHLRERSVKRSAHDCFADLWDATKIVCHGLAVGEPRLGLPALAGIFAANQCPALDGAKLENRALLLAVFKLAWLREDGSLSRVNWRDMGPEELGSVYESLLELVPQIAKDGRQFTFATGGETKGNARKTTGSYYTPDDLVQVLLDSALEPVIVDTIAKNPGNAIEALLGLSIVDPACGSGHFLLGAARRLAAHVARLQANGTPSAAEYRHALRQVVGRCIFGVDLNPMAVELCKVGLWMEAVEPGLPLTFLNSHIQHGNALLGTATELMAAGIPDAAWDPIEGDDKKTASALKKRNKKAAEGQRSFDTLWSKPANTEAQVVTSAVVELDAASDANVEALVKKEERWGDILGSPEYRHQKFVADAWCAAFVWPKQPGELADAAPTNELWRQLRDGQGKAPALTTETVDDLADQYHFFHWHLQFAQVFAKGGFDVVLGNPPWDRITFEEKEWFSSRSTTIAEAPTAAKRHASIQELQRDNPGLFSEFMAARRGTEGVAAFCSGTGKYGRTAVGHLNTYAIFTELAAEHLVRDTGRAALLAPTAVVTGDYAKALTRHLLTSGRLIATFDFDNRGKFFPAMQGNVRFAILILAGGAVGKAGEQRHTLIASQLRTTSELSGERICKLSSADVLAMNPETATLPFFYARRDAEIVAGMYRAHASLFNSSGKSSWDVDFSRMLNMSDDSGSFVTREELPNIESGLDDFLPVYEAKLTAQYDHRAATFEGIDRTTRFRLHAGTNDVPERDKTDAHHRIVPRYWLARHVVEGHLGESEYFLAYRDAISATADARSLAACYLGRVPSVHTLLLVRSPIERDTVPFAAALNSFPLDYVLRQKATGAHAARFILRQLPFPNREEFDGATPWARASLLEWLLPRVLELTYTDWELEPLARDLGHVGTPFRWNSERRFVLQCEIDAAFFHVYRLTKDDVAYVMEAFPVVRRSDEKLYGEYRTKRVILEIYDALAKAVQTGKPYRTPLDPLPAAPGASHGLFAPDGMPKDYAEALRMGLVFTLVRRSGEAGITQGTLSRALLWLEDVKHAASWLEGSVLADFEQVRGSYPLLAQGTSQTSKLLDALENEGTITRDVKGLVRLRADGSIPNWLPQTPTLAKLASVMRVGLEYAEAGASKPPAGEKSTEKAERA